MRLHDLALAQVVHDARRIGVDVTPQQAQQLLRDGPLGGTDIAQGLARTTDPVDVMNHLDQQVARGNAAGFVEDLVRLQDSYDEGAGQGAHGFPAGTSFTAPRC